MNYIRKNDVDGIYVSWMMGRRGLVSCEGCIRMEKSNRGRYAKNSVETVIEGVRALKP